MSSWQLKKQLNNSLVTRTGRSREIDDEREMTTVVKGYEGPEDTPAGLGHRKSLRDLLSVKAKSFKPGLRAIIVVTVKY